MLKCNPKGGYIGCELYRVKRGEEVVMWMGGRPWLRETAPCSMSWEQAALKCGLAVGSIPTVEQRSSV